MNTRAQKTITLRTEMQALRPAVAIGMALILIAEPASAFGVVRVPEASTMALLGGAIAMTVIVARWIKRK